MTSLNPDTRSGRPSGLRLGVYLVGADGQRADLVPAHQVDTTGPTPPYPRGWPACGCPRCKPTTTRGQAGDVPPATACGGEQ